MTDNKMDGEARYWALLADPNLVKGGRIEPVWVEDGLAFIERSGDAPVVRLVERAAGKVRWSLDAASLGGGAPQSIRLGSNGELLAVTGARWFELEPLGGAVRELTAEEIAAQASHEPQVTRPGYPTVFPPEREVSSPDRAWFLTLKDQDLWLRAREGGAMHRLTEDGASDRRWSTGGAHWSPDGRYIAAMRINERAVYRVPLVDWTGEARRIDWQVYPRADGPIQIWQVFLIDRETGAAAHIGGGDESHYAFILGFSPDGSTLRYARLDRVAKHVEIIEHDIATGGARTLFEERSESFLYWTPTFIREGPPIRLLSDGRFIWQSERSGWSQLYLYGADGGLIRRLTEDGYPVTNIVGVDEDAGAVFYRAQPDAARPYDAQLFRASLETGARTQLSAGAGVHEAVLSPQGDCYVATNSAPDRAPRTELRAADGRWTASLSDADSTGLQVLGWIAPEPFTALAADGATPLHGLIYKPADFDPARRYPVIEYIYAGAQTLFTPHAFGPGAAAALAQLGFILVMLDGRGTPGRGKAFQDVVVDRLGDYEIADHAGALRQAAASRPWMDLARVGIFGASFGGYFTIRALIQAPDLYRSAVALAPAELGHGIMSPPVESYIGLPADHPERYAVIRNTDKVQAISGDLLIITGTDDVNTPLEQTMAYAEALIAANKPFDQVIIPGVNHLLADSAGGTRNPFMLTALVRHFRRTLQP
ncbi:MAG TPA: DPP IV N-terminal domain-containing protein [Caulobacteraceae bacterium]|jgi:dipeptidyl aminopeptidase/acylaminoacyl peptidase|nr:DPP IV N-terminal domain-containing protein [Caulobacteraceae bacterium]